MTSPDTLLRPRPHPGILAIDPYVPGKAKIAGHEGPVYKMSSNETPFGPSPRAVAAYHAAADQLAIYPDGSMVELREALGARHGLDPARIVCGAGSDELLYMLALVYCEPGTEGIHTEHGFLLYPTVIRYAGAVTVKVAERDLTIDVDAILAAVTERTRIVYITNPSNPTGTYLSSDDVRRLADGLPPNVLLVVDEAYAEYATQLDFGAGFELVRDRENVVVTRTFSKIYGLATLRVGWCDAPAAVCDALNRVRPPFSVGDPAKRAGLAALADTAHFEMSVAHNTHWRAELTTAIRGFGFPVTDSAANFMLIHLRDEAEASAADTFLSSRGLILRRVTAYGLPHCLRLTVGTEQANRLVLEAFADFARQRAA